SDVPQSAAPDRRLAEGVLDHPVVYAARLLEIRPGTRHYPIGGLLDDAVDRDEPGRGGIMPNLLRGERRCIAGFGKVRRTVARGEATDGLEDGLFARRP